MNAEVPAEVAGTITKILIPDGETVAVGTAVAEIDADGAGAAADAPADTPAETAAEAPPAPMQAAEAAPSQAPPAEPEPPTQPAQAETAADAGAEAVAQQEQAPSVAAHPQAATQSPAGANGDATSRMTPAVRRLVREHGIDVAQLSGSGAGGRVTREDVLAFIEKGPQAAPQAPAAATAPAAQAQAVPAAQPATAAAAPSAAPAPAPSPTAAAGDTEVPLSQMRKAIARKMTQVKQTVPHAYTVIEVDMTNVVKWREANNMAFKAREGASLSYVAVVVKAATETLRKHPNVNSQFAEDKVIVKQAMNIGIAVAVDNGLIVPVIHNADQLSISGVNARIRDLSSRAHAGKLRLDELQGGTFTVNNTGWFGSVSSMPIINAPEVAILSMEAIVKRPRVMEIDGEDVIAIRHMMNMTCSFDHRVLDGAQVGFFLADVRKFLEEWDPNTPVG